MLIGRRAPEQWDSVDDILHALEHEARRQRWRARAIACALVLGMYMLVRVTAEDGYRDMGRAVPLVEGILFGGPVLLVALAVAPSRRLRRATRALAEVDDVRAIGSLCEFSRHILPRRTRRAIIASLERLVSHLTASDASQFREEDHACFNRLLRGLVLNRYISPSSDRMYVPLVHALEQVGDRREMDLVRAAANGKTTSRLDEAIQRSARDCLPALEMRVYPRPQDTLLRPSEADAAAGLLQPTGIGVGEDGAQLLRVAISPSCEEAPLTKPYAQEQEIIKPEH